MEYTSIYTYTSNKDGPMAVNRASIVDRNFIQHVRSLSHDVDVTEEQRSQEWSSLKGWEIVDIFHTMMQSRHLDIRARELKKTDRSFYTIGSSGHEGNACVAKAITNHLPHYRSALSIYGDQNRSTISGVWCIERMSASTQEPMAESAQSLWLCSLIFLPNVNDCRIYGLRQPLPSLERMAHLNNPDDDSILSVHLEMPVRITLQPVAHLTQQHCLITRIFPVRLFVCGTTNRDIIRTPHHGLNNDLHPIRSGTSANGLMYSNVIVSQSRGICP